ncbi:hypothetical protein RHSIM_Rhsim02G0123700 [Rhododendron simsii]|uniref:Alpha 1,4-glycosyltransferase domain-containing protein n=1 Tax=Rhododendron simsii TaxID=118357 RepID=A0A834HA49_RHOSS|nr:hypothetical protein RHSIM_Rhsim02G0123700 [Rhododendron simsii]
MQLGHKQLILKPGNWTRLNNAVMVFDKGHPILLKFIEEFARTFNGNKWGYNGPYLVSRVVQNLKGSDRFDVNILKPMAFYPLDWSRIRSLFQGPKNEAHAKWLRAKLNHICSQSYAVHLWNRQSKKIKIEEGIIIAKTISDCCVFCNSSASGFGSRKQDVKHKKIRQLLSFQLQARQKSILIDLRQTTTWGDGLVVHKSSAGSKVGSSRRAINTPLNPESVDSRLRSLDPSD